MRKHPNILKNLISILVVFAFCVAMTHVLIDYAAPHESHSDHCSEDVPVRANNQDMGASDDCSCLCHIFEQKSLTFSSLQIYMPSFLLELPPNLSPKSTYPERIERPPQA
ncbi:MAG: hypothetical protein HN757_07955 [Calditrichaeota bacterium]|jgi:hypothetical protein|nr:hypothetical protein [Calditrichota bacterium]